MAVRRPFLRVGAFSDEYTRREIESFEQRVNTKFAQDDAIASVASGASTMGGDVTGSTASSTVTRIQGVPFASGVPTLGQVPVFDGTQWTPSKFPISGYPVAEPQVLTFSLASGATSKLAYTVPTAPAGMNRFQMTMLNVRLERGIVGSGSVKIRAGTNPTGTEYLTESAAWTSSTPTGTTLGVSASSLGTGFPASNLYTASMGAGSGLYVAAITQGPITTGTVRIYVYGGLLQ